MEQTKRLSRSKSAPVLIAVLAVLLLIAFKYAAASSPLSEVSKELGVELPAAAQILSGGDEHGGFHGDGRAWYEIDTADAAFDPLPEGWNPLPLSEDARTAFYGSTVTVDGTETTILPSIPEGAALPEVTNGCWFFLDRQGTEGSVFDESRFSVNFTAALYDADTGILYYLKLDT